VRYRGCTSVGMQHTVPFTLEFSPGGVDVHSSIRDITLSRTPSFTAYLSKSFMKTYDCAVAEFLVKKPQERQAASCRHPVFIAGSLIIINQQGFQGWEALQAPRGMMLHNATETQDIDTKLTMQNLHLGSRSHSLPYVMVNQMNDFMRIERLMEAWIFDAHRHRQRVTHYIW